MTADPADALDQLDPRTRFAMQLSNLFDAYVDQFEALSDLVESVTPHANALDSPDRVTARLNEVRSQVPDAAAEEMLALFAKHTSDDSFAFGEFMRDLIDQFLQEPWGPTVVAAWDQTFRRPPRVAMLRNSLLTAAVSAFESLIGTTATAFYEAIPSALQDRDREKEFSLRDLKHFSTIDDAVDLAISRRVDELLFGSLHDWRRFFKDRMRTDFAELTSDWVQIQEIFQRRHCIVHNGGRASRKYVNSLSELPEAAPACDVGDSLNCDDEYLEASLDALLILGVLILAAVSFQFARSDEHDLAVDDLRDFGYNMLRRGRWNVTERVCGYAERHATAASDIAIFRINRLIAVKNSGRAEEIRAELHQWDMSALDPRYRMARACLIDDLDETFRLMAPLVEQRELTTDNLLEWPLFGHIRDDPRFAPIAARAREIARTPDGALVMGRKSSIVHKPSCRRAVEASPVTIDELAKRRATPCRVCKPEVG